jgi:hypothetical protein
MVMNTSLCEYECTNKYLHATYFFSNRKLKLLICLCCNEGIVGSKNHEKFSAVHGMLSAVHGKFSAVHGMLSAVHGKFSAVHGMLSAVHGKFSADHGKFSTVQKKFCAVCF